MQMQLKSYHQPIVGIAALGASAPQEAEAMSTEESNQYCPRPAKHGRRLERGTIAFQAVPRIPSCHAAEARCVREHRSVPTSEQSSGFAQSCLFRAPEWLDLVVAQIPESLDNTSTRHP